MANSLFYDGSWRLNRLFMQQIGIWPDQSQTKRIVLPIIFIVIIGSILIPEGYSFDPNDVADRFVFAIVQIVIVRETPSMEYNTSVGALKTRAIANRRYLVRVHDVWGNIDNILEALPAMLIISVSWVKLFNGSIKRSALRKLVNRVDDDWKSLSNSPSSIVILKRYAERGRMLTIAYAGFLYLSTTSFIGLPIIPLVMNIVVPLNESRPKKYLYEAEYGVDPERYYYYMLFHSYVTSYMCMTIYVIVDTTLSAWVQHCCALFEIIAFANLIESTYSASLAYITGVNMIVMSISGVLVLIKIDDFEDVLRFSVLTLAPLFHLYFNTVPGQKLIDHSQRISDSAYECDWCSLSPRAQKLLVLIIARAQRPCIITAGKLYLMNMESFSAVMQTSISYFTVFSSLRR